MALKHVLRRLPPIAWRDAKLQELKDEVREQDQRLREQRKQLRRLRGQRERARRAATALKAKEPPRPRPEAEVLADLIRSSGLFDEAWYLSQVEEPVAHALEHFIRVGERAGLSPHPAFHTPTYLAALSPPERRRRGVAQAPFRHYLRVGARWGRTPPPAVRRGSLPGRAPGVGRDPARHVRVLRDSPGHPRLRHRARGAGQGRTAQPAAAGRPAPGVTHPQPRLTPQGVVTTW